MSRETKDSIQHESKKKSTLVQDRRRQNDHRRGYEYRQMEDRDSPGIGNEGERSQEEVIHGAEMSKQSAGERDEESNEIKLEARIMKLEEQNGCTIG